VYAEYKVTPSIFPTAEYPLIAFATVRSLAGAE
jgi:hypothetical protein